MINHLVGSLSSVSFDFVPPSIHRLDQDWIYLHVDGMT